MRIPTLLVGSTVALALAAGVFAPARGQDTLRPATPDSVAARGSHLALRDQLLAALRARRTAVTALRGRAQLVISSPQWNGASQAEAAVVASRPHSLRLRAWVGPTTLFDVVGVADSCGAHLARFGAYARGPCGGLSALSGVPVDPAHVVEALFGEPFRNEAGLRVDRADGEAIYASWPAPGGGRVHGRFRKRDSTPLEYEWREKDAVRARLTYDDFLSEPVGAWPRLVVIEWPARKAMMRLQFHELDLDPELEDDLFTLMPPEGAAVLEWREALEDLDVESP